MAAYDGQLGAYGGPAPERVRAELVRRVPHAGGPSQPRVDLVDVQAPAPSLLARLSIGEATTLRAQLDEAIRAATPVCNPATGE